MYPNAPPLWEEHHQDNVTIVGVCDDPSAETYWKVANGIRLTGMPAYKRVLTDTEIWQVSLAAGQCRQAAALGRGRNPAR